MEPENEITPSRSTMSAAPPPTAPNNSRFLTNLLSILLLLTTVVAGFFAWQTQNLAKQLAQALNQAQPTNTPAAFATPEPSPEGQPSTADWERYELSQIKMEFKMPDTLNPSGKLTSKTSHNDLGWNDSSTPIQLSATSTESTFEGGFSYLNGSVGYKKSGDVYKFLAYTNTEVDMSGQLTREVVNQNQVRYLIVESDPNQVVEGMPPIGIAEKGHIAAIINTNRTDYPALVLDMKLTDSNDQDLFNLVLSTFQFLK